MSTAEQPWQVHLLGPTEVLDAQGAVRPVGGTRRRAFLALLALRSPAAVSRAEIITAIWGEDPPETVINTVQAHVSALRKVMGRDAIQRVGDGYRLDPTIVVDTKEFDDLWRQATAGAEPDVEARRDLLVAALSHWRGPALSDLREVEFAGPAAVRLEEAHLQVLEARLDTDIRAGRAPDVVGELQGLVAQHQWREQLRILLMQAQYQSGRQADALESYEQARRDLLEMGLDPSPMLRAVHGRILDQTEPVHEVRVGSDAAPTSASSPALAPFPALLAGLSTGPFVGRQQEIGELLAGLDRARSDGPVLVSLAGEPGIGKTRLAAEAAFTCHSRSVPVLYGRCTTEPMWPFEPFADALRAHAQTTTGACAAQDALEAALHDLVPEVGSGSSTAARRPAGAASEDERALAVESIVRFFGALTADGPAVLVLDDLHWATAATLVALRHLVRSPNPMPLLILATHRDTEAARSVQVADVMNDLWRDNRASTLELVGLTEPEISTFLQLEDGAPGPAGNAAALHQRTNGNPLFVTELVRQAVEFPNDESLPAALLDVIDRRTRALGDDVVRVLRAAAVIGPTFDLRVLQAMPGAAPDHGTVLDALDEALDAHLIVDDDRTRSQGYGFAHALVREAIDDGLSSGRRTQLHDEARLAIESTVAGGAEPLTALANHAIAAAPIIGPVSATSYVLRAAQAAHLRFDYEESVDLARRGLALLDGLDAPGRAELAYLAASGEVWGGAWESGLEQLQLVFGLARTEGDLVTFGRAAIDLITAMARWGAESGTTVNRLEEALDLLGSAEPALRVHLLGELAYDVGTGSADLPRGRSLAAEALDLARDTGDPDLIMTAKGYLDELLWEAPAHAQRAALCDEVAQLPTAAINPWTLGVEVYYRARLAFETGQPDFRLLLSHLDDERPRGGDFDGLDDLWRGFLGLLVGDFETTEIATMTALGSLRRPNAIVVAFVQFFCLRREQGRGGEVAELVAQAVVDAPEAVAMRAALSLAHLDGGDRQAAWSNLEVLLDAGCATLANRPTWTAAAVVTAEIVADLAKDVATEALEQLLLPMSGTLVLPGLNSCCLGAVDRALGQLALARGDLDRAADAFTRAAELEARVGAPTLVARTKYWHARTLMAGPDDGHGLARSLLDDAEQTAEALGMALLRSNCSDLREAAGADLR